MLRAYNSFVCTQCQRTAFCSVRVTAPKLPSPFVFSLLTLLEIDVDQVRMGEKMGKKSGGAVVISCMRRHVSLIPPSCFFCFFHPQCNAVLAVYVIDCLYPWPLLHTLPLAQNHHVLRILISFRPRPINRKA